MYYFNANMMKRKIISGIIFIIVGQIIALMIWKFFNENYFIPVLVGSIVAFLAGYKENKESKI